MKTLFFYFIFNIKKRKRIQLDSFFLIKFILKKNTNFGENRYKRFKKYLRPSTLFNASKCADYIAQLQTNGLKNNLRSKIRGNV